MFKRLLLFQILGCLLLVGVAQVNAIGAQGTVTLDSRVYDDDEGMTIWSYTLTHVSGTITEWRYDGANIKFAWCQSWRYEYGKSYCRFYNGTLTSGSKSGFVIHSIGDDPGGIGNWICHESSGTVSGPSNATLSSPTVTTASVSTITHNSASVVML